MMSMPLWVLMSFRSPSPEMMILAPASSASDTNLSSSGSRQARPSAIASKNWTSWASLARYDSLPLSPKYRSNFSRSMRLSISLHVASFWAMTKCPATMTRILACLDRGRMTALIRTLESMTMAGVLFVIEHAGYVAFRDPFFGSTVAHTGKLCIH